MRDDAIFRVAFSKDRLTVHFQGKKVGGLDCSKGHFYISKVFARDHALSELLKAHGFEWIINGDAHQYWRLNGIHNHQSFRSVIEEMAKTQVHAGQYP